MSGFVRDFDRARPPIPSLLHLSVVKIAVPLFNDFGFEILESAYTEIEPGNSAGFKESKQENCMVSKAKEELLFIPSHLRRSVFEAFKGMDCATFEWKSTYAHFINLKGVKCNFCWRFDGLIDSTKTAQQLILDSEIPLKERFDLACVFCLVKSIQALWAEMKDCDKREYLETDYHQVAIFWVKWIREGCLIPWVQAFSDFFKVRTSAIVPHRYSFFPLLPPEKRGHFFSTFGWGAGSEDTQLCLYILTAEEKRHFLEKDCLKIILLYMRWPLQSVFLETVQVLLPYMDHETHFPVLLIMIWTNYERESRKKDSVYYKLLVDLWHAVPQYFRDYGEECGFLKKILDEIIPKRKYIYSDANQEKRMRTSNKF